MSRRAILLVSVLVVVLFGAPSSTVANMHSNTIDPAAVLGPQGRQADVTVLLSCDPGEWLTVRLTVTQEDTNSLAEGHTFEICTGPVQRLKTRVYAGYATALGEGDADACALAVTWQGGKVTDTRQWCKAVVLQTQP
jgi:hypothetical protein